MNVHRTSSDTNDQINTIKSEMIACSFTNDENDDMKVDIKGFLHNGKGFILTANNMEKVTDSILQSWRYIITKKGFECNMTYDFNDGWVDIKCTRKPSKTCLKARHLSIFGYLSMIIFCIYLLWYRQNKMRQE